MSGWLDVADVNLVSYTQSHEGCFDKCIKLIFTLSRCAETTRYLCVCLSLSIGVLSVSELPDFISFWCVIFFDARLKQQQRPATNRDGFVVNYAPFFPTKFSMLNHIFPTDFSFKYFPNAANIYRNGLLWALTHATVL